MNEMIMRRATNLRVAQTQFFVYTRLVVVFGGGQLCFRGGDVCFDVMWHDVMWLVAR